MPVSKEVNNPDKNVLQLSDYKNDSYNLHFALHDPIHCLAPGLFRSLKKGDRKKLKLDITYEFGNGKKIEFHGPEPLGADDLRVLQGLVAIAGTKHHESFVNSSTNSEVGIQIRENMQLKWDAINENIVVAQGSFRDLAREIGWSDFENTKLIQKSIERLWMVSIIYEANKKRIGCHLLSTYASDSSKGKLFVGLNPMITKVIFGNESHTRIIMSEVRNLKSDAARLIHQRLCAWIDPGKSRNIGIDTLIDYVWYEKTINAHTLKTRKSDIRKALKELSEIKWTVNEYKRNLYQIIRPKDNIEVLARN